MKLGVFEGKNQVKEIELNALVSDQSEALLYQTVVARLSHERQGNASTLTKSEVRGGGKKPWKQKGLGRARAGSTRSPLWRGGGVTFGPKPRDFSKAINRKQRSKAYLTVFAKMAELGLLRVFSDFELNTNKTKQFVQFVSPHIEAGERITVIIPEYDRKFYLASRNLPNVTLLCADNLDILPLVYSDRILVSEKAVLALEARYKTAVEK